MSGTLPAPAPLFPLPRCDSDGAAALRCGGIATGATIGGHTLNTSLGQTGPATLRVAMVAAGLIPLAALAMQCAGRTTTSNAKHRLYSCAARPAHA